MDKKHDNIYVWGKGLSPQFKYGMLQKVQGWHSRGSNSGIKLCTECMGLYNEVASTKSAHLTNSAIYIVVSESNISLKILPLGECSSLGKCQWLIG